jgi:hypothetical protein
LARMCTGHVLKDSGDVADSIPEEAATVIKAGPAGLTLDERDEQRYVLTDLLDDLRGTSDSVEAAFIGGRLLEVIGSLVLMGSLQWTGRGKWLARELADLDGGFGQRLSEGLTALAVSGCKQPLIDVVSDVLDGVGGPLTEGYAAGHFLKSP